MLSFPLAGCKTGTTAKCLTKVALAGEAKIEGYVSEGEFGIAKELLGAINLTVEVPSVGCLVSSALEAPHELGGGKAEDGSPGVKEKALGHHGLGVIHASAEIEGA